VEIASKRHRFAFGFVLSLSGMVVGFAACTDSYRSDLSGSASGSGGMSGGNGSTDSGNTLTVGSGSACDNTCSNDLKRVVDCVGDTRVQCTADQGCANAKCIDDPCKAAEVSKSSYGCDYWAIKTAQRSSVGACFAAVVANTWEKPIKLTVSYGTKSVTPETFAYIPHANGGNIDYQPYDPASGLPSGEVAILFLSRQSGNGSQCPRKAWYDNVETGVPSPPGSLFSGTGRGTAFHITTDYPAVAYQINPYGGGPSSTSAATLLLPTSAWAKNYVAINPYKASTIDLGGWPSLEVLAYQDNTSVTILPKVKIEGSMTLPAAPSNTPATYVLKAGEFLQISQAAELTGSPIAADKPIGVFGAADCMTVPADKLWCDSAQQQLAPVQATGSEYAAVRYRNRIANKEESVPWRLVGMAAETVLTWVPSTPPNAPTTLGLGEIKEFSAPGPFVVKSQDNKHPFYLGGYMTGSEDYNQLGDPEWVNVTPPSQFLDKYVFFTDPTYPDTNLVVVRTKSKKDGKFADVTLGCLAKPLTGWQPLGDYEYTRVDLVKDFVGTEKCTNGSQVMQSALPFGVTVWGWGTTALQTAQVSYAYPAGAGFQPINEVVVPPTPQ
jgi:IgGFc binding protein